MPPERHIGGPKLAIAQLLPHDSGQLPGAGQFIQPNDVEPVDRLDLPPALGTPMPAICHGANFHTSRAKPDGCRIGSIAHAGRGAFHADHAGTLSRCLLSSQSTPSLKQCSPALRSGSKLAMHLCSMQSLRLTLSRVQRCSSHRLSRHNNHAPVQRPALNWPRRCSSAPPWPRQCH
jgi:hypothetical protein